MSDFTTQNHERRIKELEARIEQMNHLLAMDEAMFMAVNSILTKLTGKVMILEAQLELMQGAGNGNQS